MNLGNLTKDLIMTDTQKEFEIFYESIAKSIPQIGYEQEPMDAAYCAWQHQQNRIVELEAKHKGMVEVYDRCRIEIESLQAKLNVAVEALEKVRDCYSGDLTNKYSIEALAEINKIGE
jgi:hypothetical protein